MQYHASSLRPEYENAPTGAYVYHAYYDNIAGSNDMAVIDFVYAASNLNGSSWANRVDKYLDGLGRIVSEIGFTIGFEMDMVNTKYDNIGRTWQQTRPYRLNTSWTPQETVQWTTYAYDPLDRVTSITAPDGSISYRYYNESSYPSAASSSTAKGFTIRVRDAWGRERWGRLDEQNRLVEVVEPNPSGDGTVATDGLLTQYSYNALGSLTDVTQGSQSRSFKYDDLGRLVAQRLAERDATLDVSGQFVATWNTTTQQYAGGAWSDVFSYDTRSNLVWKKDARGVKTTFDYNNDPLNRLQSVSYSTSNVPTDYATRLGSLAGTIAAAPKVNYSYETTSGKDKTRLTNVYVDQGLNTPLTGMGNQAFGYDAEGRLSTVSQTFTGISSSYALNMSYGYDYLDRVTDVTYPAQYGLTTVGKVVHQNYDLASRLSSLTYDGTNFASNPVYNASSQTKNLTIGSQITESYTFDPQTGLLTNQQVLKGSTALMNLDYNYTTNNATNNVGAKTGQLTFVKDNLNTDRNRSYSYDKLGRLSGATGGITAPKTWTQAYSYDRYGNRLTVTKSGNDASNNAVALDGLASVNYNTANNRINSAGYQYDPAGNQVQSNENGVSKTYQYDAAGRLVKIFNSSGGQIGCNIYGASNQRLQYMEGATTTYYAWAGGNVVAEYFPSGTNALQWNKSYVYLGGRLLATATNNAGTATTQFQHPDRLGTRLTTDTNGNLLSENVNLPFGASMPNATSLNGSGQPTLGEGYLPSGATQSTKKRFTSYDRSDMTGLDYAVNRHYSATQGRFTQVDPIGMSAVSLGDPQSLNLYAYCGNDPVNQTDPDGLFSWKKLFGFFAKALKIVLIVGLIVGAVLLGGAFIAIKLGIEAGGWFGSAFLGFMHGLGAMMGWASPSVVFSLAATGSAAAWAGTAIWAFGAMAAVGAVSALTQSQSMPSRKAILERQYPKNNPCAPEKRRFFDWLLTPLAKLAKDLDTNRDFLLAHAAREAGWQMKDLDHNIPLNNPFGSNYINNKGQAAGNMKFSSLDAALDYYKTKYNHIKGAKTMEDFAHRVKYLPDGRVYNSNSAYEGELAGLYSSVLKYKKLCGIE